MNQDNFITKEQLQSYAEKYLGAKKRINSNDDYYGDYEVELIAIIKFDKKLWEDSLEVFHYFFKGHNGISIPLKEYKNDKDLDNLKNEFEYEIQAIYVPTLKVQKIGMLKIHLKKVLENLSKIKNYQ